MPYAYDAVAGAILFNLAAVVFFKWVFLWDRPTPTVSHNAAIIARVVKESLALCPINHKYTDFAYTDTEEIPRWPNTTPGTKGLISTPNAPSWLR